ncbi:DUF4136 domain-containing protein [Shewanella intestini]|uniref:DUF4136 domain-containing protein n=1 Tax=Shewanella intestini TaxID=2017544 RepID=A0ABS5I2G7_9GAMM|nr:MULTISPECIES: DUF4136 domain-containing protein [Shewanella]MBR9728213.1 DUF4136 domain-containing protein [Shewanella intestini]MRG35678.1 DUF4136 domain-containing protein [Shewanella sp. XMDDZSB0408]
MNKIIALIALASLSACSSMKTSSDFDPAVSFSQYKTYAWIEKKNQDSQYQLDGLMDQRVKTAVDNEMSNKGLTKTDAQRADLLVNYLTKVDKKINVDTFNTHYGYNPNYYRGWGWGGSVNTQTTVREYEVGTMIIDLVDNKTDKLVWRGTVADTVSDKNTPEERVEVINEAIKKVMLNFPPQADAN